LEKPPWKGNEVSDSNIEVIFFAIKFFAVFKIPSYLTIDIICDNFQFSFSFTITFTVRQFIRCAVQTEKFKFIYKYYYRQPRSSLTV